MLTMQWQCLLSLSAIILCTMHSVPVLAASKTLSWGEYYRDYSLNRTIVANIRVSQNKQKQTSNLFEQLNLTREQQQQIKRVHRQYTQKIRKKKSYLATVQQQLSDMIVGTESVTLIRAKNQQLVTIRQEIGALRFESILATREILTPEQRKKFRELVKFQLAQ